MARAHPRAGDRAGRRPLGPGPVAGRDSQTYNPTTARAAGRAAAGRAVGRLAGRRSARRPRLLENTVVRQPDYLAAARRGCSPTTDCRSGGTGWRGQIVRAAAPVRPGRAGGAELRLLRPDPVRARRSCASGGSAGCRSSRWRPVRRSASCTWSGTSRRRPSSGWTSWSPTCSRPTGATSATLPWMSERTRERGAGQAGGVHPEDRLPGPVAGLPRAGRARRRPGRQRAPGRRFRAGPGSGEARRAGGPRRVVHVAADGQRLLQPGDERDRLPGRDSAAAVLRPRRRRRGELRRDRRRHRARDRPRVRRPGLEVRRSRRAARLVDARGPGGLRACSPAG